MLPLHLPHNTGQGAPGAARGAGLVHATGDYLVFVNGDDTLAPGSLQAIADRVKDAAEPDVLTYGLARIDWSGETTPQVHQAHHARENVSEAPPGPFSLADRPGVLHRLADAACGATYRRDFVERHGFAFPPGHFADLAWTLPILLTAQTIATLDRVCAHVRERRRGNIRATPARKEFDIFGQYDRVMAFVDSRPALESWRPVIFRRMTDHAMSVFTTPGRLPRGSRAAYFRRARDQYRRHRRYRRSGAGFRVRVRDALVWAGSHRTYRALLAARGLRTATAGRAAAAYAALRGAALRIHYRVQLRLPVRRDHAVFMARRRGSDAAAIEAKVRELAPHIRTSWIAETPDAQKGLLRGSAAYWAALARSAYLVGDGVFAERLVKRPSQILLRTHDGTPIASTGLDLRERPAAAHGVDFEGLLRDCDTWDYSLSANRHSSLVRERAFPSSSYPSSYTTLEYGSPRNDRFRRVGDGEVAALRASLGVPDGCTAVLYAPAHRDYRRTQRLALDPERVARALGPDFVLLTDPQLPKNPELLLAVDALVTDFSPLMVDYAHLDRPIVVYADDWEAYEAARGTYVDLRTDPPGAIARTEDELIDIFTTGHWRGSRSAQLRAAFRARFCPYDDGHAAERVVRHVFLGETDFHPPYAHSPDR
ncbi:CDP-glycerol glycerophosphotransferase family protein [Streptomyces sp. NPDC000410]|uniref:CDP-glycerol glycerophosphotransferase family protein n=1 Tax=Streptomyces sp. NPDC000410 TaxID=3154254 RepID=UPI0033170C63